MKKLILLPIVLISLFVCGQEIPKKVNTIIVTFTSADSIFSIVGTGLLDNDFVIDEKDREFKTFKATYSPKEYSYTVKVNIRINDTTVIIKGLALNGGYEFESEYTSYGGAPKRSFLDLNKFALSLKGKISYEKIK